MNEIPDRLNKIEALRDYLEVNKSDKEGDSWIFGHNPKITAFLNGFSKEEYNRLKSEVGEWSDAILYHLADPIFDVKGGVIDGAYMYCQLFEQINNHEYLEYLIQNLSAAVWQVKEDCPRIFWDRILNKAIHVDTHFGNLYSPTVEQIKRKMREQYGS